MTQQMPNVRTWSKNVPPYLFEVGDLDAFVLKEHHEIVRAMGRERAAGGGEWPQVVVVVLCMIVPASAFAVGWGGVLSSSREVEGVGGREAADLAAWCFAFVAVGLLVIAGRWWRSERHWSGLEVGGVVTSGVAGLLTLGAMRNQSGVDIIRFEPVSIPVWSTVAVSVLVGGLLAFGSRGKRVSFRRYFRVTGSADTDQARRLIAELEPRRHQKLLDERRRAITRLRDRGLLDERQVAELRSLPLGWSPTLDW